MITRRYNSEVLLILLLLAVLNLLPAIAVAQPAEQPYVILVGLDGFRSDFADRYGATHIQALRDHGVCAAALIPSYPSSTFPNFYTIATGLYPEHHGLVDMEFYDPALQRFFRYNDGHSADEGVWWGGTPLWVAAERKGVRTATFFWVGSGAEIMGVRPSTWVRYDPKRTGESLVAQALESLGQPPQTRPHLVTLYLSDVDRAGHMSGPDSPETAAAVKHVDALVGQLEAGLKRLRLPANLILVSDHGMDAVDGTWIVLDELADLSGLAATGVGPQAMIYVPDRARQDKIFRTLRGKDPRFEVYRRAELPARLHYSNNPRIGDLVVMAKQPVLLEAHRKPGTHPLKGMHGYDPEKFPNMRGIFYADGPDLRHGLKIKAFENIHIAPFVGRLLGVELPAGIDGKMEVLSPLIVTH